MNRFFADLNQKETKSLTLTKEDGKGHKSEGNCLMTYVQNMLELMETGLAKIEEINETSERLKEYESDQKLL